mmetsp:Transcript_11156/g.30852  ORF Transcript_11156/g.30852 Transcript_11156/m.30852 type:complete len:262 (+) Transcript_11156:1652-2437(+)
MASFHRCHWRRYCSGTSAAVIHHGVRAACLIRVMAGDLTGIGYWIDGILQRAGVRDRFEDHVLADWDILPSVVQHVSSGRYHLILADVFLQPAVIVVAPGTIVAQSACRVMPATETAVVIAHGVAVVDGFLPIIVAGEHLREIETSQRKVDQGVDLFASVRVRRKVESLQVNDQDGRGTVQMELFPRAHMLLALAAVPHLRIFQLFHLAVLLDAILNGDRLVPFRCIGIGVLFTFRVDAFWVDVVHFVFGIELLVIETLIE